MQSVNVYTTACRLIKVSAVSSFTPSWGVCLRATGLHVPAMESSRLHTARGQITLRGAEVSSPAHAEPGSHFIFIHHHMTLLLYWKMRRSRWGGTEARRMAKLPLLESKVCLFYYCDFPSQDWLTIINNIDWFLVSWRWPLEEKRVLLRIFCTDAEILLNFWSLCSLMFHLCLILILSSWEINSSERLHSFLRLLSPQAVISIRTVSLLSLMEEASGTWGVFATVFVVIHSRVGTRNQGKAEGLLWDSAWRRWTL